MSRFQNVPGEEGEEGDKQSNEGVGAEGRHPHTGQRRGDIEEEEKGQAQAADGRAHQLPGAAEEGRPRVEAGEGAADQVREEPKGTQKGEGEVRGGKREGKEEGEGG